MKQRHRIFGRPPASAEDKRGVKIAVFLTEAEAETMREKAKEANMTPPEFLRHTGLSKKIEARKSIFDAPALELLRAAGQNINQSARELSRARKENLSFDSSRLEAILQEQLDVLRALQIAVNDYR